MAKNKKCTCAPKPPIEISEADRERFEKEADKALEDASIHLLVQQAFFGTLVCGLRRVPMWNMPTMGVDGVHLFYNPSFTLHLSAKERQAVVCHEVIHLAFSHLHRRKSRRQGKWNAACDFVDNLVVKDANFTLPNIAALLDEQYRGKAAEEVYNILPDKPSECGFGGKCEECGGEKGEEGWDSWDDHLDPAIDEEELAEKIVRAYEQTKHQGKLPAGLESVINQLRNPRVSWDEFLIRRAIDIFQREQYCWERRSRISDPIAKSMGVKAVWIPGMAKEEQRNLALFIDTSGSCQGALEAFASEIAYLIPLATNTYLCTIDADAHEFIEVFPYDKLLEKIKFRGGGGTDFRPPFKELEKRKIKPDLCIYFTDGYGTFPETQPDFPVIWAFTEDHQAAPWGDAIVIKDTR